MKCRYLQTKAQSVEMPKMCDACAAAGMVPTSGYLCSSSSGPPALALLCKTATSLLAYQLPSHAQQPVSLAFSLTGVASVAVVEATGGRCTEGPFEWVRELLLQKMDGRLVLLRDGKELCFLEVPLGPVPAGSAGGMESGTGEGAAKRHWSNSYLALASTLLFVKGSK